VLKITIIATITALLLIGICPAFASSSKEYPSRIYTYYVTPNELANMTLVKNAATYWEQYGFHLRYSDNNPQTIITLNKFCNGYSVGTFNTTDHAINIYTNCIVHNTNYAFTEKVLSHEFGHFLGFAHYSIPIMNPIIDS